MYKCERQRRTAGTGIQLVTQPALSVSNRLNCPRLSLFKPYTQALHIWTGYVATAERELEHAARWAFSYISCTSVWGD